MPAPDTGSATTTPDIDDARIVLNDYGTLGCIGWDELLPLDPTQLKFVASHSHSHQCGGGKGIDLKRSLCLITSVYDSKVSDRVFKLGVLENVV